MLTPLYVYYSLFGSPLDHSAFHICLSLHRFFCSISDKRITLTEQTFNKSATLQCTTTLVSWFDQDYVIVGTWHGHGVRTDVQYDRILSRNPFTSFHHNLDVAQEEEASEAIVTGCTFGSNILLCHYCQPAASNIVRHLIKYTANMINILDSTFSSTLQAELAARYPEKIEEVKSAAQSRTLLIHECCYLIYTNIGYFG